MDQKLNKKNIGSTGAFGDPLPTYEQEQKTSNENNWAMFNLLRGVRV